MKPLREQFINKMKISGLTERTIANYVLTVERLTRYYRCNPLDLTSDQIEAYRLFMLQEKKFAPSTVNLNVNAIKTFFRLMKPGSTATKGCVRMKIPKHLPIVLSREEVERLIAAVSNLKHKVILMLLYSCGLRLSECIEIKPIHIESTRMKVRVEQGKGCKDRYTILPQRTLLTLREYFRKFRPNEWLIEGKGGKQYGRRSVGIVVSNAALKARLGKTVTPHTLRHRLSHPCFLSVRSPVLRTVFFYKSFASPPT